MKFTDAGFVSAGKGKGKWEVAFGGITEKVKYSNENFINASGNTGYSLIEREDGQKVHVFFSMLEDGHEILTSTGAVTKQMELGQTLLNSLHPKEDLEAHFASHLSCIAGKKVKADQDTMQKQMKNIADKVYEVGRQAILKSMGM